MKTELLYYENSYLFDFSATVISCTKVEKGFEVVLDKTAFFPEGGGQKGDTGTINGVAVTDTQIKDGVVIHYCKNAVNCGMAECSLNSRHRFARMQIHSGEHIVSGIAHSLYGCENVGFHMDDECAVIDFDRELTDDELDMVEEKANEAIWCNYAVKAYFPNESELKTLDYRSKLELTENVRIVNIENVDVCACCAPHVHSTGEVGVIKIIDRLRHRGGIRFTIKCGKSAYEDYRNKHNYCAETGAALSVKPEAIPARVNKLLEDADALRREYNAFKMSVASASADQMVKTSTDAYFVTDSFDSDMMRELVNLTVDGVRLSAVFSGSDEKGYSYIAASKSMDSRDISALINSPLNGRGGGRDGMVQGKAACTKAQIDDFFKEIQV